MQKRDRDDRDGDRAGGRPDRGGDRGGFGGERRPRRF
jgi:small subunit ribosomal protein S6